MELIIKESQNIGLSINKDIYFNITKYEYLKSINTKEKMFEWLIYNDTMFSSLYRFSKEELNVIYLYVTNKISFDILKNRLCNINTINYTMLLNRINNYSKKYNSLINKTITKITIVCNKQNLLKILSLDLNKKNITLENDDITFKDFYDLLTGIDLKKYDDLGVKIKIVESSKPITLSRLYNIVSITKAVAEKIDGMNLSNFEKIIYIYDIVKEKIYKKDKNNSWVCRDIDDVILGDFIVCTGYSRRINVQSSFHNIESIMLCSKQENHAINLIYIKDEKYNPFAYEAVRIKGEKGRKCPICGKVMEKIKVGDTILDRCPSLHGVWFDKGELGSFVNFSNSKETSTKTVKFLGEVFNIKKAWKYWNGTDFKIQEIHKK